MATRWRTVRHGNSVQLQRFSKVEPEEVAAPKVPKVKVEPEEVAAELPEAPTPTAAEDVAVVAVKPRTARAKKSSG